MEGEIVNTHNPPPPPGCAPVYLISDIFTQRVTESYSFNIIR